MTLQGIRTCGDYMFSGHTCTLTLLNFFITEYTSRKIYFLHTFTWIVNAFGVFFILVSMNLFSGKRYLAGIGIFWPAPSGSIARLLWLKFFS